MAFPNGSPHVSQPMKTTPLPNPKEQSEARKKRKYQGALTGLKVAATPVAGNMAGTFGGGGTIGTGQSIGPK